MSQPRRAVFGWIGLVLLVLGLGLATLASDPARLLAIAVAQERGAGGLELQTMQWEQHSITYLRGGAAGGEPVVLLHGFAADKDNWTRFSKHMKAAGYAVVVPDLPGHGVSSRLPEHTYAISNQVAFVAALADHLALDTFHIAGNSMGGQISAAFAAKHPERVRSLGLFNAGGVTSPVPSERTRILMETGTNPLLVNDLEDFDRLLSFVFVQPPSLPRVVKRFFANRAVESRPFNDKIWGDISGENYQPLEPHLASITARTLVLWGDGDRVLHPSGADVFAAGIPDSRTVIMEKMGHSPMIERPADTAAIYIHFLGDGG
ncbi:MAG: alpha/beta fold hydrolase [Deltaproteobacteria bacterium]|nr:alpha/beta fold hydrolase [Deltaproteobacteria bacterium]